MQQRFEAFIGKHGLCSAKKQVMLSVSGGIDSMVMTHLFLKSQFPFAIAHCNFNLRQREADEDETFVKNFAVTNNIPFFSASFNTQKHAEDRKISIQMAARELRINWIENLILQNNYDRYATAHHLDDQIETFFNNLLRGTGIHGLHGILPRQDKLIHPMLFCYRHEIEQYATDNNIAFRTDSSNNKTDYQRNKIRHNLIPVFEMIKPDFKWVMTRNIENLKAAENVYQNYIDSLKRTLVKEESGLIKIVKKGILDLENRKSVLFELLNPFEFNISQVKSIIKNANISQGAVFQSTTHRLVIDREYFIVEIHDEQKTEVYQVKADDQEIEIPVKMSVISYEHNSGIAINSSPLIAMLDGDKLKFPLILRKWQKGDIFYPLGMSNKKLLSDFFIDNKFSIPEKDNTWILESDHQIAWIVGHRIDERFKITNSTKKVFEFKLKGISND